MPLLVARRHLPGAAPSRPVLPPLVAERVEAAPAAPKVGQQSAPAISLRGTLTTAPASAGVDRASAPASAAGATARPAAAAPPSESSTNADKPAAAAEGKTAASAPAKPVRFSLAVVQSAGFLWLETLVGAGLSAPQRQLLTGMAAAVEGRAPALREMPFDWPLHDNPQLDRSASAAAAALDGFLQRLLAERSCRGICLLGDDAPLGLVAESIGVPLLRLPSTRAMLEAPLRKREAWRLLAPLLTAQA